MEATDFASALASPGNTWDQGDIVNAAYFPAVDKAMPAVLITPACDIEQEKVDLWTFVALFPDVDVARAVVSKDLTSWRLGAAALSQKQRTSLANALRALVTQRLPRYHWIPVPVGDSPGHVADFSCVTSLPIAEIKKTASRIASLRSSWREQLPARYSAFMARVGTVDFRDDALAGQVERLVNAVVAT